MRAPVVVLLRFAPRAAREHIRPGSVAGAGSTAGCGSPRTARGHLAVAVPVALIAGLAVIASGAASVAVIASGAASAAVIASGAASAAVIAPEAATVIPCRLLARRFGAGATG
ncbi:MAG TPA: hypothetical protein VNW50_08085 [Streptosporangiaceae bacterium]|nr:hypothetical protein [Streptosporangiaceae bacterium]